VSIYILQPQRISNIDEEEVALIAGPVCV